MKQKQSDARITAVFLSSAIDAWGAEESLLLLARHLPSHGVDPLLWTPSPALAQRWRQSVGTGVHVRPLHPRGKMRTALAWTHDLAAEHPRSIAVIFSLDLTLMAAFRLGAKQRPLLVLDLHDFLPTHAGRLKLLAAGHAHSGVIAISNFNASQVPGHRNIKTIRRPIETTSATSPSRPIASRVADSTPHVGVLGRVDPDKQIELAMESLSFLPSSVEMIVRGAPTRGYEDYASRLASYGRERFGDRIQFMGRVASEDAMQGIDVLVVANDREAMGRTVLEAQIAGIPVVVPDRGGAAELVIASKTGEKFESGKPESLAAAIERALSIDAKRLLETQESTRLETSPDLYAARYANFLLELANKSGHLS